MSAFDQSIPDLLERKAKEIRERIVKLEAEKIAKINDLDKNLSCIIAHWQGELSQLEQLKDLKWDYYASLHTGKKK